MHIAILTYDKEPNLISSDRKLIPLLNSYGVQTSIEIWNNPDVDWTQYDFLLFRNTWDYFIFPKAFDLWLKNLKARQVKTLNDIDTIIWNKHKFYLRELESKGIKVIPSLYITASEYPLHSMNIPENWDQVVLKPAVSAGSYLTEVLDKKDVLGALKLYFINSDGQDCILQQFIPEIKVAGELSFIFFNKKFSHAVLKIPQSGDFRVQFQFGGKYQLVHPEKHLIDQAEKIIHHISGPLLYARVDGIIINDEFYLMELELIEPDLYLDLVPDGQKKFVSHLLEYCTLVHD